VKTRPSAYPHIRVGTRVHTPITVHSQVDTKTHADLDTCGEVDIISIAFAREHRLRQAHLSPVLLRAVHDSKVPTYGVWIVPLTVVDSRGVSRKIVRPCMAIDRDPRALGSPVLLSVTTLTDEHIVIDARENRWWFATRSHQLEILTPKKFAKICRSMATVQVVIKMPGDGVYLDDEWANGAGNEGVPPDLHEFLDVFSKQLSDVLPSHKLTDHAIDLEAGAVPPFGALYPLSQTELKVLWEYIAENLKRGRIRASKSPAGAPILFVPKKDGTLRLCVDYRGLNKVTVKNRYALPLISEILDRIAGAQFFSKIDVREAYYRIRIQEGDEWKTAFRTRYGHYEYLVMPFGLTNAPATFQSYMHTALHDILDTFCVAYLDDILVFSRTRRDHTEHLKQVLERMRKAQLYAKLEKCAFYQDKIEFLGFILSSTGIAMDPDRVDTVSTWKEPETYREVQVFLGFCNFYRRFIYGYSAIAAPLTGLLKGSDKGRKPGRVTFGEKEKEAFEQLKSAFTVAPLLRHFEPELPIRLETDASGFAMAGILSQPDSGGIWHPVAFWSRKFIDAELNYGTPDQEMMAIVESFKNWRHYLEGSRHRVEVYSDHANLQEFMKHPKLNGRQARWAMLLAPYDFVIKHRPGSRNPADGPSRRPDYEGESVANTELLAPLRQRLVGVSIQAARAHLLDTLKEHGEMPLWARSAHARVHEKTGESLPPSPEQRVLREEARVAVASEDVYEPELSAPLKTLIVRAQAEDRATQERKEALSCTPGRSKNDWSLDPEDTVYWKGRLYVPEQEAIRAELLRLYHDDPLAGHFGVARTKELLKRKFHWRGIDAAVDQYVQSCAICQGIVARRHRPYGTLVSLPIPSRPFQELSMDFITGLPPSIYNKEEVDSVLVIVDRYTKYSIFLPVAVTITAADLAAIFHDAVELRFGPPKGIVSDRGSVFTSKFWSELCYYSRVTRRLSTAFHPQTDGQTERANQTLEHYLRAFINEEQGNWPQLLKTAEYACNNSLNATTGVAPFEALIGYRPEFRAEIEGDFSQGRVPSIQDRLVKLGQLRGRLVDHWSNAQRNQQEYYDRRRQPMQFKKGDLVGLSTKNLRLKVPSRKLAPKFIGPFRVLNPVGSNAYRLALPHQYARLHNVFPVSLLEPWHSRDGADKLPMPPLEEDDDEWEIEEVQNQGKIDGELHWYVKWRGWPSEYNQWVSDEDMANARGAIQAYEKRKKSTRAQARKARSSQEKAKR